MRRAPRESPGRGVVHWDLLGPPDPRLGVHFFRYSLGISAEGELLGPGQDREGDSGGTLAGGFSAGDHSSPTPGGGRLSGVPTLCAPLRAAISKNATPYTSPGGRSPITESKPAT